MQRAWEFPMWDPAAAAAGMASRLNLPAKEMDTWLMPQASATA
jgi:hypothetical protein